MKQRRALLISIMVVLALCVACGLWLHREWQYNERNHQLMDALTIHGNPRRALALVNAGADPNTRFAPSPASSFKGVFDQLLHRKPSPVNDGPTALMLACGLHDIPLGGGSILEIGGEEDIPLIQAMLAHHAEVNARMGGNDTALHFAVSQNRFRTVELLLQHGADINAQNAWGHTPLMRATGNDTPNVTHLLLAHGANVHLQNTFGWTVLYRAVRTKTSGTILRELLLHGADANEPNKGGDTPLHFAQQNHRIDLLRLFQQGAK